MPALSQSVSFPGQRPVARAAPGRKQPLCRDGQEAAAAACSRLCDRPRFRRAQALWPCRPAPRAGDPSGDRSGPAAIVRVAAGSRHRHGPPARGGRHDRRAGVEPVPPQAGVFLHQARVTRTGRSLLVCARGNDATEHAPEDPGAIARFTIAEGVLSQAQHLEMPQGVGPRHLDLGRT